MKLIYIVGLVLMIGLLVSPVMAKHCSDGEQWTCTDTQVCSWEWVKQWEAWDYRNTGQCVSDCKPDGHGKYCAVSCNLWVLDYQCHTEEECGCVAVSCPAIPCETGYQCEDNQCVPDTEVCGIDFFCDPGYVCYENSCIVPPNPCDNVVCEPYQVCLAGECIGEPPSPCDNIVCDPGYFCINGNCVKIPQCATDVECKEGYQCVDGECVVIPTKPHKPLISSGFHPYTEEICSDLISNRFPMNGVNLLGRPRLGIDTELISALFKYDSQFDCVYIRTFINGEPTYTRLCDGVTWWNQEQVAPHSYGGMPRVSVMNAARAICFGYVKNNPDEMTLPVIITVTDTQGFSMDLTSTSAHKEYCYSLDDDYSRCRTPGMYIPYPDWVN